MARRSVESDATGETFVFDDDWNDPDGRVHQFEFTIAPRSRVPPHAHPATAETWEVVSGVLSVRFGGRTLALGPGERATTAPGEAHSLWNAGAEVAHVRSWYDPPLAIEPFFTVIPQALASGNLLKTAVLWTESRRVSQPSFPLGALIAVLGGVGRMMGMSHWYRPLLIQAGLRQD